ncbi:hypothetical protein L204_105350 [Cryptococcus depauperatus]
MSPPAAKQPTDPPFDTKKDAKDMILVARSEREVWQQIFGDAGKEKDIKSGENDSARDSIPPLAVDTILYPTLTTHPPPTPYSMLVVSLADIAATPATVSNDDIFQTILSRLEPLVGEEGDGKYVLIVMATDGKDGRRRMPSMAWWVWKWKRIPHRFRKNAKRFYIVHPSLFTRSLLPLILPFVSPKSYTKLYPVPSLLSLYYEHGVPLEGISITLPVLEAESQALKEHPELAKPTSKLRRSSQSGLEKMTSRDSTKLRRLSGSESSMLSWSVSAFTSAVGSVASYIGLAHPHSQSAIGAGQTSKPQGYWKRSLEELMDEFGGRIPPLVVQICNVILQECIETEGVFRKSLRLVQVIDPLKHFLDMPIDRQPRLNWTQLAQRDPLLPPKVLGMFLKELTGPLIKPELYDLIRGVLTPVNVHNVFLPALSPSARSLILYITHMLHHFSFHESTTQMHPSALAICFAPCLISGPDALQDAEMLLDPGKQLHAEMVGYHTKEDGKTGLTRTKGNGTVKGVLEILIAQWPSISGPEYLLDAGNCDCTWDNSATFDNGNGDSSCASVKSQKCKSKSRHSLRSHVSPIAVVSSS